MVVLKLLSKLSHIGTPQEHKYQTPYFRHFFKRYEASLTESAVCPETPQAEPSAPRTLKQPFDLPIVIEENPLR